MSMPRNEIGSEKELKHRVHDLYANYNIVYRSVH